MVQGWSTHKQGQQIAQFSGDCWELFWLAPQSVDWQQCRGKEERKRERMRRGMILLSWSKKVITLFLPPYHHIVHFCSATHALTGELYPTTKLPALKNYSSQQRKLLLSSRRWKERNKGNRLSFLPDPLKTGREESIVLLSWETDTNSLRLG